MRCLIGTTAIVALTQISFALADGEGPAIRSNGVFAAPDPGNCATPYEPKVCPPLPRRALKYYPGERARRPLTQADEE